MASPDYFDLDRRLDELVQIAAEQSQRLREKGATREPADLQETLRMMERGRRIERIVADGMRRREQRRSIDSHEGRDTGMEGEPPAVRASPDNFDLNRRLDALVQIAVAQNQSMHEMAVSIQEQGRQIQEHGRQIDRIIDAIMSLAKRSDENGQRE